MRKNREGRRRRRELEGEEGINTICGALWGSSHCNKVW